MSNSTRRAVGLSVAGNYGSLLITFGLMVIVSRWLEPAEIGAFVVAYALVVTIDAVRELNVGSYLIQIPALSRSLYRSIFGFSLVLSICFAVLLYFSAGFVSDFFESDDVEPMLQIMATGFLLSPLAMPTLAFLNREMRFNELMLVRVGSATLRAFVTIALIALDFGNMSLAWGFVASRFGEAIAVRWTTSPYTILRPSLRNLRPIANFGFKTTLAQVLGTVGMSIADLATGRFLGLAPAGIYNRGASLVAMYRNGIEGAILPVAYSRFAQISREPDGKVAIFYLHSLRLLSAFGWPALAVLGVLAHPLMYILFGEEWLPGAPVAQIIAFGAAIYIMSLPAPKLLTAIGQIDALLKRELAIQIPRIIMVVAGAQFSIEGVAWGVAATYTLAFIVNHSIVRSAIGVTFTDIWNASKEGAVAALATGCATLIVSVIMRSLGASAILEVTGSLLAGGTTWLCVVLIFDQPAGQEVRIAWQALHRRFFD